MKKSHRIIRDVSLVVVFCVGFLALIGFANFLQATPEQETSSEFSQYRTEADEAAQSRDLDASLENLRSMVTKDPYDGRAQYELASTLFSKVIEAQTADDDPSSNESPNVATATSDQQDPLDTSPEQPAPPTANDNTKAKVRTLVDQAIQEYQLAENHVRYRLRSQFQLAMLWAAKGDHELALESLEKFVEGGGVTRSGLGEIEQFGKSYRSGPTKLHADPRFLDLIDREINNRIARGGYRGFESRRRLSSMANRSPFPTAMQTSTNLWNLLQRLNDDLIPYRIKLIDFIRVLFK